MSKALWGRLLDYVFPVECVICSTEKHYFCVDCRSSIVPIPDGHCLLCSRSHKSRLCEACRATYGIDDLIVVGSYRDTVLETVIAELKFNFIESLAEPLADLLLDKIIATGYQSRLHESLIIPVPLSSRRYRERGFNQSQLIATRIAEQCSVKVESSVVIRVRTTQQQARLNRDERWRNIADAFVCQQPEKIVARDIFIFDDVVTSGATMGELARCLKRSGARNIVGLAIAHG